MEERDDNQTIMKKYLLIALSLSMLLLVFLFQRISYAGVVNTMLPDSIQMVSPNVIFSVNKIVRLILNDVACMIFIYAVFKKQIYLKASFYLFLAELFVILPLYLVVKLNLEGDSELSSPLLSQIHRLIVNPLLMFLLMLGFVYQRLKVEKS
jgi:exosortase F-associated protein